MNKFLGFLGLTKKAGNLIEGYNKCEEYIRNKRPFLLIIANDASENTKKKFIGYCRDREIPYIDVIDKNSLGSAVGRDEISVMFVKNIKMASKLLDLWTMFESRS